MMVFSEFPRKEFHQMIVTLLISDLYILVVPIHGRIGLMVNSFDIDTHYTILYNKK